MQCFLPMGTAINFGRRWWYDVWVYVTTNTDFYLEITTKPLLYICIGLYLYLYKIEKARSKDKKGFNDAIAKAIGWLKLYLSQILLSVWRIGVHWRNLNIKYRLIINVNRKIKKMMLWLLQPYLLHVLAMINVYFSIGDFNMYIFMHAHQNNCLGKRWKFSVSKVMCCVPT